jgi:hypothetical protein
VLTLAEAAAYMRLPEADVAGLVHSQGLPGCCIATEWRFLKAAVEHWLGAAPPSWEARKAGILELAGKYKKEPDLEQIAEEAYRRRGRPLELWALNAVGRIANPSSASQVLNHEFDESNESRQKTEFGRQTNHRTGGPHRAERHHSLKSLRAPTRRRSSSRAFLSLGHVSSSYPDSSASHECSIPITARA